MPTLGILYAFTVGQNQAGSGTQAKHSAFMLTALFCAKNRALLRKRREEIYLVPSTARSLVFAAYPTRLDSPLWTRPLKSKEETSQSHFKTHKGDTISGWLGQEIPAQLFACLHLSPGAHKGLEVGTRKQSLQTFSRQGMGTMKEAHMGTSPNRSPP